MTEPGMQSSATDQQRLARRRTVKIVLVVGVLAFLLVQSITVTLPIRARVVDAQSGEPVRGARIVALWSLKMATLHSYDPAGEVRISHVTTGTEGEFELPLAFIVHPPVAPFSLLLRSESGMPRLIILADGYALAREANDVYGIDGPAHDPGVLSLRHSSIDESTIRLTPLSLKTSQEYLEEEVRVSGLELDIWTAESSCRRRTTCVGDSLGEVLRTIKQRREEAGKQRREQSREQGTFRRDPQGPHISVGAIGRRERMQCGGCI